MKAHIALNVTNLKESLVFYKSLLGVSPVKVRPGYAKFDVEDPPLNLTLNTSDRVEKRGALSHLGIQVAGTKDVLVIRDRWSAAGLNPREELGTSCCYALQDKVWVTDPEGNSWEAFTVLADIEQPQGDACCGPANLVAITL
jgi:catechol 2,3-dioxygenase-like lactoylglutathione lyase family enzyme